MAFLFLFIILISSSFAYFPPEPRCDEILIEENFTSASNLSSIWSWYNEPSNWSLTPNGLRVYPEAETDFWSRSYYDFIHDNGHFLYTNLPNDMNYTIYTQVTLLPSHQFDQAGLMARFSSDSWLKLAAEYIDDEFSHLGSVITNYFSDWSTRDISTKNNHIIQYRLAKIGFSWVLHAKLQENDKWEQLRIGYLEGVEGVQQVPVGLFACSPTDAGFRADFQYIKICKFNSFLPSELGCMK